MSDPVFGEWQPIETAPFNTVVDLWCINGEEIFNSWDGEAPIGEIKRRRHKDEKYGWFGNESKEGVPNGHGKDLIPLAWTPRLPTPSLEMVRKLSGKPDYPTPPKAD